MQGTVHSISLLDTFASLISPLRPTLYKQIVERFRVMVTFMRFLAESFAAQEKKPNVRAMFA
jgi:hypothetical protein